MVFQNQDWIKKPQTMQKTAYQGFKKNSTLNEMYTKNACVVKFKHIHETTKYNIFFCLCIAY
jgi:hypothetical protein